MQQENLIRAGEFCTHHHIDVSFLYSLQEFGLAELVRIDEVEFIDGDNVVEIEKMIRMHYDLDINFEGLDAIRHMVQRMELLQDELEKVRDRLKWYEAINNAYNPVNNI